MGDQAPEIEIASAADEGEFARRTGELLVPGDRPFPDAVHDHRPLLPLMFRRSSA
jgi:hypothetical protein